MSILGNCKDNFVGNFKDNSERATSTMGFDPKATQYSFSDVFLVVFSGGYTALLQRI